MAWKPGRKEFLDKFSALTTAAFGLVAALAWNSYIQELFAVYVVPRFGEDSRLWSLLFYAIAVTLLAVLFTLWIAAAAARAENAQWRRREERREQERQRPPPQPVGPPGRPA